MRFQIICKIIEVAETQCHSDKNIPRAVHSDTLQAIISSNQTRNVQMMTTEY